MNPFNSILVLSNPNAGNGRATKVASVIIARLDAMKLKYVYHSIEWPATLENFTAVFLVGGDGTLNYMINKYHDIPIPIAIFKGGSGNDFAWKLYSNLTLNQYFDRVICNDLQEIDAGICNERLFINGFGIGFDGAIVQAMRGKKKISAGHLAYLYTVIKNVLFFRESKISIKINDNNQRVEKPFLIAVANGERYGGGFRIAPGASMNDGYLDLVLIKEISPFRRLFKIPLVQGGRHLSLNFVEHQQLQRILIEPAGYVPAHCDGEPIVAHSFDIKVDVGRYRFFV